MGMLPCVLLGVLGGSFLVICWCWVPLRHWCSRRFQSKQPSEDGEAADAALTLGTEEAAADDAEHDCQGWAPASPSVLQAAVEDPDRPGRVDPSYARSIGPPLCARYRWTRGWRFCKLRSVDPDGTSSVLWVRLACE